MKIKFFLSLLIFIFISCNKVENTSESVNSSPLIKKSITLLQKYEAINLAIPVSDTVVIAKNSLIDTILDRDQIFLSQTPQSFRYQTIFNAHKLSSGARVGTVKRKGLYF